MKNEGVRKKGFTLLEILVSIAIISIIAGLSTPIYLSFQRKNELSIATTTAVNYIRMAQIFSQSGERDSSWGVAVKEDKIILFKGEDYDSRNVDFDEFFALSGNITQSGLSEIVFEKLTGLPQEDGEMFFSSGINEGRKIVINQKGIIDYD